MKRAALLAAAVLLVGCGGGSSSDGPATTAATATTFGSAVVATPAPTTAGSVVDAMGRTVEVPDDPTRIVALSEPAVDGLLALGITPLAITAGRGQTGATGYLANQLDGVPIVAALAAPNYEAIAALRPDLILVDGTSTSDASAIDLLAGIAPTVFVSVTGEDWQVAFRALGDAIGRHDQVEQVLADYRDRVVWLQAELGPKVDTTVSIVRWGLLTPALMLKELLPSKVIADVGFRRPPSQDREGPGHSEPVSLEQLQTIDADWIFIGTIGGASGQGAGGASDEGTGKAASIEAIARAEQTPGFTLLAAYQAGHVVPVDGSAWMSAGGPLAAGVILDDVLAAVGGSNP
ncbi:MAG: iron-siderophore ABC transporter substrate-binding protein [Ilumatobacteraceae bacterium]